MHWMTASAHSANRWLIWRSRCGRLSAFSPTWMSLGTISGSMCTAVSALVTFHARSCSENVCTRHACTVKPEFHCISYTGEYKKRKGPRKTPGFVYRRSNYIVYDLGMRARYAYMLIIYAISQVNGQMMGHNALCHESENIHFPQIGEGDDMGPFLDQGYGDHLGPGEPGSPFEGPRS